ncbi:hypothetical protein G9O61_00g021890 [Vairimorpha ceranae]|nr:hypothetical protein G9O61_00g021890 [Vairimorpha ceranae]
MDKLINEDHENKKYLPGIKLPDNLCYTSDIQLFSDIDIIIVALPHQFIDSLIKFKEYLKKDIIVLSVVKGVIEYKVSFTLVSDYINEIWGCSTNVLMGANIASDVAKGLLGNILYKCEGTLGYHQEYDRDVLFRLLNCKYYKISCTKDVVGVELCGSLKNIIALGYGVTVGLGCSKNTSISFLRCGLGEIKKFLNFFFPATSSETLFQSCGIADLIVSCSMGRNYKFGKAKAEEDISLEDFEKKIGNQKIQGVGTANCIYNYLITKERKDDFPIIKMIWSIFCDNEECDKILDSF